ncbi:MAG: glycine--tRNA ligase subunit beta [Holosporales bacterium]|jgi:glycyl-tRNA synthetase beta chain|nr:glycine--tRNA ligase subunit beta [Holosporales bacterium]
MKNELLLEIFSEEIPARFQRRAVNNAKELFEKVLREYGVDFDNVSAYVSVRRIAIRVENMLSKTHSINERKRGPRVSAPENAVIGFLNSNNKFMEDLIEKDGYLYLQITIPGSDVREILSDIIEEFLEAFPWPKSMRWYIGKTNELSCFWVRPIRSILCIYDGFPIRKFIKSVGLEMGDTTRGHRFIANNEEFSVTCFDDYVAKLEKAYVMLDYQKKVSYIDFELAKRVAEMGLCIQNDEELLHEVAGLVEYPFIHIGQIEEKFMNLPKEVLSTTMKVHQKYFTLIYPNNVAAPFYGTVTNVSPTEAMREGLDRVLRARLSDAAFFFKEDTDISLDAFSQRLSDVVFHEKLGSVSQKIGRILSVSETKEENRAISICKADLVTQMVGEFPELQGIMGGIYALNQEETQEVAEAIAEHYRPNGANDRLPANVVGARISFFDKLDTLVGFIGFDVYPTGSKDPYALRRAAFSIVRLICDSEFDVLCGEKLSYFAKTLNEAYSDQGIQLHPDVVNNVLGFICDRFTKYVEDKLKVSAQLVEAVINSYDSCDFDYKEAIEKVKSFNELSKHDGFSIVQSAYKRAIGVADVLIPDDFIKDIQSISFNNNYMNNAKSAILKFNSSCGIGEIVDVSKLIIEACDNVTMLDRDQSVMFSNLLLLKKFVSVVKQHTGIC